MNTRRALFAIVVCFALLASTGMQFVRAADDDDNTGNNTTTASVSVAAGGVFDAYFCDPAGILNVTSGALGAVTLTSTSLETTVQTGELAICYDDTKPNRPEFKTYIQSGNFTSGSDILPASGFKVTKTFWILQSQWSSKTPGVTDGIGDIGMYSGSGGTKNQKDGGSVPLDWHGVWLENNTLNAWRAVHYGKEGRGTSDGSGDITTELPNHIDIWLTNHAPLGSLGVIEVTLDIPDSTPAGTYSATVTLQVNFEAP